MYAKYVKRAFDIVICSIGIPVFVLFYIVFGSIIKGSDRGPVFYKSERIGKDSKIFYMYKFRSMKVNAPFILNIDGSTYNAEDDPRVTGIGKFMRETSIDEIPQLLNVLKGEMSIIGPRACLPADASTFKEDEKDKVKVKPGITGYTQAYFRNSISSREKRVLDAWYANHVSFGLDAKIFLKTIRTVLKKEGLYTNKAGESKTDKNEAPKEE